MSRSDGAIAVHAQRLGRALAVAAVLMYGACLLLPSFEVLNGHSDASPGYVVLFLGVFALVPSGESPFFSFAWLANVAFLVTVFNLATRPFIACAFAWFGVVLSAAFSLVRETYMQGMCIMHPIKLQVGYAAWVASMLVLLASAVVCTTLRGRDTTFERRWRVLLIVGGLAAAAYLALGLTWPASTNCPLIVEPRQ